MFSKDVSEILSFLFSTIFWKKFFSFLFFYLLEFMFLQKVALSEILQCLCFCCFVFISILTVRTSCLSRHLNWTQFNLQSVSSISSIAAVSSTWSVSQCAVLCTCCEALCFRCACQDGYDWWRAGHALKACLITASLWWQQDLQAPLDSQMCSNTELNSLHLRALLNNASCQTVQLDGFTSELR